MSSATESRVPPTDLDAIAEPGSPPFPVRRFGVDEYLKLVDGGFFDEDPRFELLEGWIVPTMTKNPPHNTAVELAYEALNLLVRGRGFHVRNQNSARTGESVPGPDLMIARGSIRDYAKRHPNPDELALVVEVSDSSLARDRHIKNRIYARAGIRVYWIIDLVDRRIEVYTDPTGPCDAPMYGTRTDYLEAESIPLVLDCREVGLVPVSDVLP